MAIHPSNSNKPAIKFTDTSDDFKPLKIYLLRRIFAAGYDEYDAKVIIAISTKSARAIANMRTGDEGRIWADPKQVMCAQVTADNPGVILASFNAGG